MTTDLTASSSTSAPSQCFSICSVQRLFSSKYRTKWGKRVKKMMKKVLRMYWAYAELLWVPNLHFRSCHNLFPFICYMQNWNSAPKKTAFLVTRMLNILYNIVSEDESCMIVNKCRNLNFVWKNFRQTNMSTLPRQK
jgi:hypothetical protein